MVEPYYYAESIEGRNTCTSTKALNKGVVRHVDNAALCCQSALNSYQRWPEATPYLSSYQDARTNAIVIFYFFAGLNAFFPHCCAHTIIMSGNAKFIATYRIIQLHPSSVYVFWFWHYSEHNHFCSGLHMRK